MSPKSAAPALPYEDSREPESDYDRVAERPAENDDALTTPLLVDWTLPPSQLFRPNQ